MAEVTKNQLGKTKTDAERLSWALQFAQGNLEEWRDGDWLNALEDATNLLFGGEPVPATGVELYRVLKRRDVGQARNLLTKLQPSLRDFIEQLHKGKPAAVPFRGRRIFLAGDQRLDYADEPTSKDTKRGFVNETLLRVGDLLTRVDISRLKQCPECGRFFLAVRRQSFDRPECSLRVRVRRFRMGRKAAEKKKSR